MKLKNIFLVFSLCSLFGIYGYIKKNNPGKRVGQSFVVKKMLWGKWVSDKDKKDVLIFHKSFCVNVYDGRVIDTSSYVLSTSCKISDSSKSVDSFNAYLIFINAYSETTYHECNEIMCLDKGVLSYQNSSTGSLHVFTKAK